MFEAIQKIRVSVNPDNGIVYVKGTNASRLSDDLPEDKRKFKLMFLNMAEFIASYGYRIKRIKGGRNIYPEITQAIEEESNKMEPLEKNLFQSVMCEFERP